MCGGSGSNRTISFSSPAAGTSATITLVTRVNDNVGPGVGWTNTATLNAATSDPNPGNNTGGAGSGQPTITDPDGDTDGDGLPNGWQERYGLNPLSNSVDNGPNGDPDGDGKTNLQEFQEGTHPRGFVIGGARETETYVLIANTSAFGGTARVTVLFEDGSAPITRDFTLAASSRSNVTPAAHFPETAGKRFGMRPGVPGLRRPVHHAATIIGEGFRDSEDLDGRRPEWAPRAPRWPTSTGWWCATSSRSRQPRSGSTRRKCSAGNCARRRSTPRSSCFPPPRTSRRKAASPTRNACCTGTIEPSNRQVTRAARRGSCITSVGV